MQFRSNSIRAKSASFLGELHNPILFKNRQRTGCGALAECLPAAELKVPALANRLIIRFDNFVQNRQIGFSKERMLVQTLRHVARMRSRQNRQRLVTYPISKKLYQRYFHLIFGRGM